MKAKRINFLSLALPFLLISIFSIKVHFAVETFDDDFTNAVNTELFSDTELRELNRLTVLNKKGTVPRRKIDLIHDNQVDTIKGRLSGTKKNEARKKAAKNRKRGAATYIQ